MSSSTRSRSSSILCNHRPTQTASRDRPFADGGSFRTPGAPGATLRRYTRITSWRRRRDSKSPKLTGRNMRILSVSIGTDPNLTMNTRRGTGYYKVPSLKGVWYRSMFEHSGSVATLEDWFDPSRLRDDYVPTGFKGYGVKTRAVPGHEYGLNLSTGRQESVGGISQDALSCVSIAAVAHCAH